MTSVGKLWQYPVKSMQGEEVDQILVGPGGVAGDRAYVHIGDEAVVHIVGPTRRCVMTTLPQPGLPKDSEVLKTVARVNMKEMGSLGQFPCAGSYAEVVTPGVVRRGDPIRFERVQPRKGALAATIDMMTAALAAD